MRIRSIKPEFWKSESIAALTWQARLLFIGLWSYVDDNGVGRDNEKLIAAELFPLEDDPRETLATVSRGLQELCGAGRIVRYIAQGRAYLFVSNWKEHQRIDKANKPRYPLPTSDDTEIRETLAESSRHPRETPAPGSGNREQGNEGSGSSGTRANGAREADAPGPPVQADAWKLVRDTIPANHPQATKTALALEAGGMLVGGTPPADVTAALELWLSKPNLGPRTLPSLVSEVIRSRDRPPAAANSNGHAVSTTDLRVAQAQALKSRPGTNPLELT